MPREGLIALAIILTLSVLAGGRPQAVEAEPAFTEIAPATVVLPRDCDRRAAPAGRPDSESGYSQPAAAASI